MLNLIQFLVTVVAILTTTIFIGVGIDINVISVYLVSCVHALNLLANELNFDYDYMYNKDHFLATNSDEDFSWDFTLDNGVHFLDERIIYTNGVADPAEAAVRDNTVANGYDPGTSHQPYARNLAAKLEELRNGSSQLPNNLVPADERFINALCPHCWNNYNPNRHYKNSVTMRNFLKNLR